jgi:hypothetical protein
VDVRAWNLGSRSKTSSTRLTMARRRDVVADPLYRQESSAPGFTEQPRAQLSTTVPELPPLHR